MLDKLNIKFQYNMVDVTTINATIDIIISILSQHFFIQEWTYVWSYKQELGKILEGIPRKSSIDLWKQYKR